MAEYIDMEAILAAFALEDYPWTDFEDAWKMVQNAPVEDVAPVKHGKWDDSLDGITPYCSICGRTHGCVIRCPSYCPNCGAKMDLEE